MKHRWTWRILHGCIIGITNVPTCMWWTEHRTTSHCRLDLFIVGIFLSCGIRYYSLWIFRNCMVRGWWFVFITGSRYFRNSRLILLFIHTGVNVANPENRKLNCVLKNTFPESVFSHLFWSDVIQNTTFSRLERVLGCVLIAWFFKHLSNSL